MTKFKVELVLEDVASFEVEAESEEQAIDQAKILFKANSADFIAETWLEELEAEESESAGS